MLDVQHLSVWYGVTEVLRDVSFSVREGSVVALLGGNGSGKSTLLNALSGLIAPKSGSVRYLGQETAGFGAHQIDRKSTRLNSSHLGISYAVFCLKKKNT